MKPGRLAGFLVWVVPALWSSNYVVARLSQGVIHPHLLALGRWVLALALLLPWVWSDWRAYRANWRRDVPRWFVLGALGMWICGAFVYQGAHSTTALNIALIFAAAPVGIAVISARLLHEPMAMAQKVGTLAALGGVLFVVGRGDIDNLLHVRFSVGDAWVLAATVAWIVYSVLLRRWSSELPALAQLAAVIAAGIVVLLPFTLAEAMVLPPLPMGRMAWMLIALAALLPGVLSYGAYSYLQRELGAARTALMLYLAPLYGALLGWLVLGERPGWHHAMGAVLILPGIALATRR